jgi:LacI family transcriptional regulator
MATCGIKEVASRAGVSIGTVSNVLNRPDLVSPGTRQRVLDAIDQLGFVRNESARQLRVGRSRTVGLVVLDVANPFFTDVARGAEQLAAGSGNLVVLCSSADDVSREVHYLNLLEEQRVQGVLITPVHTDNPRLDHLVERGIPVVLVGRCSGRVDRCSVAADDVLGGRIAATHLIEQGHRRIAFVGSSGPMAPRQVTERYEGAAQACRHTAQPVDLSIIDTRELTLSAGRAAGERLAEQSVDVRPTAVFCANDLVALGLLQALTTSGVRVPDDVAIVGYDNIDYAGCAVVPLTSVRQPRNQIGERAAELLLEEVRNEAGHIHQQVLFTPTLVVRQSSAWSRPLGAVEPSLRTGPAARRGQTPSPAAKSASAATATNAAPATAWVRPDPAERV